MGLSWQQGPLGRNPNGTFLTLTPMPERMLYVEPLRRGMSVEFGGGIVARSDGAVLLFEPGRYPVAYFPVSDLAEGVLEPTDRETTHEDLGSTRWFDAVGEDGRRARRGAWQHVDPPAQAVALRDTVIADALQPIEGQTFCPYKGLASYYDKVTITLDGEKLEPVPGQTVVPHGADRNLSVDEVGGVQLVEV
jgi:uncharacterized protein (DUF427 family)